MSSSLQGPVGPGSVTGLRSAWDHCCLEKGLPTKPAAISVTPRGVFVLWYNLSAYCMALTYRSRKTKPGHTVPRNVISITTNQAFGNPKHLAPIVTHKSPAAGDHMFLRKKIGTVQSRVVRDYPTGKSQACSSELDCKVAPFMPAMKSTPPQDLSNHTMSRLRSAFRRGTP